MPDRRRHRGAHPRDEVLFAADRLPVLRRAVAELSWLLGRGYATSSALALVGDRYQLAERQRTAVLRCSCAEDALRGRLARQAPPGRAVGRELVLDGYNLLTTLEAGLAGGFLLRGRDGCLRDMASMHGTWRVVEETLPALEIAARTVRLLGLGRCTWLLDRPVSNSARLAARIAETGRRLGVPWEVELVPDPDPLLARSRTWVATADSAVLDRGGPWLNLAALAVGVEVPGARILDLDGPLPREGA